MLLDDVLYQFNHSIRNLDNLCINMYIQSYAYAPDSVSNT